MVCHTFKCSEETEDRPVCQPLSIIICGRGLEGLEGVVRWDKEAQGVGEERGEDVEEDELKDAQG